ncbi:MAG: phosphatase PAP2 family protein [Limisphaerales bacterium]
MATLLAGESRRKPRFPRRWLWAALGVALIASAFLLDGPVESYSRIETSPRLQQAAHLLSRAGEGWVIGVGGLVLSGVFWFRGRFNTARLIFLIGTVSLLTGLSATVMRSLVGRTRPHAEVPQGVYGVWHESHWLIGQYQFGSFPSGHAATVVGLAVAVWMARRRLALVVAAYAALVSWSRVAQGCHHFSDIVAATVLAIIWAPFLFRLLDPWTAWLAARLLTLSPVSAERQPSAMDSSPWGPHHETLRRVSAPEHSDIFDLSRAR